ncbi:MAG: hypothetical protein FWE78_03275 [Methanimicrococcus sp.]|nr:hypothetical protein [Methanimicrococcus sp.]
MSKNLFILRTKEKLPKSILILIQTILNNLIAVVIHICMCFFFLIHAFILYEIGSWSYEIFIWVAMGIYTLFALLLYFWAGKLFLSNTRIVMTNIFSVIGLIILLIYNAYNWNDPYSLDALTLPFLSLFEIISFIFQIPSGAMERKYIHFALAPLPSLTMLAGLIAKQKGYNFKESKIMIFFKNQVNKFKKRS